MTDSSRLSPHALSHLGSTAGNPMLPLGRDLIRVGSRRWFLQTGLSGLAGLTLADTLRQSSLAATGGGAAASYDKKAVILFWLSGGPSHIDMWDPKPDAPAGNPRTLPGRSRPTCPAFRFASTCRCKPGSWTS